MQADGTYAAPVASWAGIAVVEVVDSPLRLVFSGCIRRMMWNEKTALFDFSVYFCLPSACKAFSNASLRSLRLRVSTKMKMSPGRPLINAPKRAIDHWLHHY